MPRDLERTLQPIVDEAVKQAFGVRIAELSEDLSARLNDPLAGFSIDAHRSYKQAKKQFRKEYLRKLLRINYGNISEVARQANVDRRSIHRLIKETGVDVGKIRHDMERSYDVQTQGVSSVISSVLDSYKSVLHPTKLSEAYRNVPVLSKAIIDQIPDQPLPLDAAEAGFERAYLRQALALHGTVTATAKKIGLRYETLHRKCKKLGLA